MSLTTAEAIRSRRATRRYTNQEITDATLNTITELALQAPTAFNAQRADLVVIRDQKIKNSIFANSHQKHHRDAPVVFALLARTHKPTDLTDTVGEARADYVNNYYSTLDATALRDGAIKDAMIIGSFLLLAAQSEGLATCPTTGFDPTDVAQTLGAPEGHEVALIITMGYPDETPEHPGRAANRLINNHY